MSEAEAFLAEKSRKTEAALKEYLDGWRGVPQTLDDAIRYSLFAGGKRLRPALALGTAEVMGGNEDVALPAACALEMIHTYSLIHDDLPCMDDDDLRRGKATSHKVFGDAVAILAGDGLLTMAFDLLASTGNIEVVREVAKASGITGMAAGQVLDLEGEGKTLTLEQLQHIHDCKTGALITASVRSGAILAGARDKELTALTEYAGHLGLAFQIADDVLDVTGTSAQLGKPAGSDAALDKATYPAVVGLGEAKRLAAASAERACQSIEKMGHKALILKQLACYVVKRSA